MVAGSSALLAAAREAAANVELYLRAAWHADQPDRRRRQQLRDNGGMDWTRGAPRA